MRKNYNVAFVKRPIITQSDFVLTMSAQVNACDTIEELPTIGDVVQSYREIFNRKPDDYMFMVISFTIRDRENEILHKFVKENMDAYLSYCEECEYQGWDNGGTMRGFYEVQRWLKSQDK